jgi:undecaprenyl-diphosphatase
MNTLHAIILGIVEGITEFLPISSTGHLILANKFLGITETDFVKSFDIFIQLGAIFAVLAYRGLALKSWKVFSRVALAFIPTGIVGLAVYPFVKKVLLGNTSIVLWSLLIGGLALIAFEKWHNKKATDIAQIEHISYKQAVGVGCFQTLAIIPGVSRSAATIVGGMLLGISRETIVEFSFLLAIPTMAAATGLDLIKSHSLLSGGNVGLLVVGFVASFISALLAIRWLLTFIKKHTFTPFGIYRVVLAAILLVV